MSLVEFPNEHTCASVPHDVLAMLFVACEHTLSTSVSCHTYRLAGNDVKDLQWPLRTLYGPLDDANQIQLETWILTRQWLERYHRW